MNIHNILRKIPFFDHLTLNELQALVDITEIRPVLKNEKIDIKNINSFGVIIEGMFELGQRSKKEIIFPAPGSFFGEIPFSEGSHTGILKAATDSMVMLIKPEEMYRLLLLSFKALKGYINNIQRNGLETDNSGKTFLECNSKVVTVFSPYSDSGNSLLSSVLGLILSNYGNTIILDASYSGNSVFNIFNVDMPPAVSQKAGDKNLDDKIIRDRIINISENLSLLNIASGSRVGVNPAILSPVIFILSNKYKFIIIDHSGLEKDLREGVMAVSDIVLSLIKDIKDKQFLHDIFDSFLKDGQRVYYILNRFYSKNTGTFEGGYIFDDLEINKKESILSNIKNIIEGRNRPELFDDLTRQITRVKTGLVVQSNLANSVFLSGFFSSLYDKDIKTDIIYSSSWSYLIAALFILSGDQKEFDENFVRFFREENIKNLLGVTFPEEYIYRNSGIYNLISDVAADKRLEHYTILPAALLTDATFNEYRILSTGYISDVFTASFLTNIFESRKIGNNYYHSGYPYNTVRPGSLFRTDISDIRCISVNNKQKLNFGKKVSEFFKGYIDGLDNACAFTMTPKIKNDFSIDVNIGKYNIKEILSVSKEICKEFK